MVMIGMKSIRIALTAGIAAAVAIGGGPTAAADPHIPNPSTGECAGGSMGSPIWMGFCDGERYPDGSYWHTRQWGIPLYGNPNGLAAPTAAPTAPSASSTMGRRCRRRHRRADAVERSEP